MKNRVLYVFLLLIVATVFYTFTDFRLSTSMDSFLALGDHKSHNIARQLTKSSLSQVMLLGIGSSYSLTEQDDSISDIARRFSDCVGTIEGITEVRNSVSSTDQEDFYNIYFPRRFMFLSSNPERELPQKLSDEGLEHLAVSLKVKLTGPTGVFIRNLVTRDPWLSFIDLIDNLRKERKYLSEVDGQFVSHDGYAILFAKMSVSAFDSAGQTRIVEEVYKCFDSEDNDLQLEMASLGRVFADTERRMKADISKLSIVSSVAITALFVLLFGSLLRLFAGVVPILIGLLVAILGTHLVFGEIHAITLAFGSALIGVCIDYPVHLYSHHDFGENNSSGRMTAKRVTPGLVLASMTTICGLVGLAWTELPGIREISIFSTIGIVSSLLVTIVWLPSTLGVGKRKTKLQAELARGLYQILLMARSRRIAVGLFLVLMLAVTAVGVVGIEWENDLQKLSPVDQSLLDESSKLQKRIGYIDGKLMVVVQSEDLQTALQRNDEVYLVLRQAQESSTIGQFQSLHPLLRSASLQKRNLATIQALPQLHERTLMSLQKVGFREDSFEDIMALSRDTGSYLTYDEVISSNLSFLVEPFVVYSEDKWLIVSYIDNVVDRDDFTGRLRALDDTYYIDRSAAFSEAYSRYRSEVLQLIALGLLVVFGILLVRLRDFRLAVWVLLPAILAGACSLGLLSLAGEVLHILHVLALIVVLSMGVDYTIFLNEAQNHGPKDIEAALVSTTAACLSTICSFSVLALSVSPALNAIGKVVGLGVVLSLVLSIIVLSLSSKLKCRKVGE